MGLRRTRRCTPALGWPAAACLGLALSLSTASAQDRQIQEPKSTGLIVDTPARFQTWRKITLGAYKGVNGYRNALDAAGIKIGDSADEILGRPAFRYAGMKTEVELTLLSAAKLGAESESALSDLYNRAKRIGLELCPAEVGPQLRLDYRNQPLGESLNIAMEPVASGVGSGVVPPAPCPSWTSRYWPGPRVIEGSDVTFEEKRPVPVALEYCTDQPAREVGVEPRLKSSMKSWVYVAPELPPPP